ncbi:hypothetical protein B0T17DRAFT_600813 [Bombardia bombarda]|uniref:Uncharacterized protein n=1 Tax=Bombardia bombarda TaxID=252184 RepID=A0AA40BXW3_9PEZI|nr:hypothetical protein B0T17DRAFT_600813 [Bombardia bombarda]
MAYSKGSAAVFKGVMQSITQMATKPDGLLLQTHHHRQILTPRSIIKMRSVFLLIGVALAVPVLARQYPHYGNIAARQAAEGSTCAWTGHCGGDKCDEDEDCDDDLVCRNSRCTNPTSTTTIRTRTTSTKSTSTKKTSTKSTSTKSTSTRTTSTRVTTTAAPTSTCAWQGHCLGATCTKHTDCDGDLACISGKCSLVSTSSSIVATTRQPTSTTTTTTTTTTRRSSSTSTTVTRTTSPPTVTSSTSTATAPTSTRASCGDNPLACIGVSCSTDADCGFELIICQNGICGL